MVELALQTSRFLLTCIIIRSAPSSANWYHVTLSVCLECLSVRMSKPKSQTQIDWADSQSQTTPVNPRKRNTPDASPITDAEPTNSDIMK